MDKRCTVCNHSQAHDINLALLAGATLDTLKQQFGLSRSALHRNVAPRTFLRTMYNWSCGNNTGPEIHF